MSPKAKIGIGVVVGFVMLIVVFMVIGMLTHPSGHTPSRQAPSFERDDSRMLDRLEEKYDPASRSLDGLERKYEKYE